MPVAERLDVRRRTREIEADAAGLTASVEGGEPVILRGLARDWPLIRAAAESPRAAADQLMRFYDGKPVTAFLDAPDGRFHYDETATAMNFASRRMALGEVLALLLDGGTTQSIYIGSTDLDTYLPGFRAENDLRPADDTFVRHPPVASIWIGNRTIASAHYDQSNNAAVCAAGRRRFTLFPPDQVAGLYPGPLAPTPGGQVVSMVDFARPDLDRYPRFAEAIAAAQVAELEPGDVLVYPALWWHHVEALAPFNILVNYWWNEAPAFLDTPADTLLHAMLTLRDRPIGEKQAWRALFDYYIFGDPEVAAGHLPEAARGPLAALDDTGARRLRAYLLHRLNR